MLILSESDLRALLKMTDVIAAVEEGFAAIAHGLAQVPERLRLDIPAHNGVLLEMPAHLSADQSSANSEAQGALGTKIVTVFAQNAAKQLDAIQAVYLLLDGATGEPLALMEGRFITAIRTAATSAVATKRMARACAETLAVFGAGVQARFHIEAMLAVREIKRALIASRTRTRADVLKEHIVSQYSIPCEVVAHEEAAARADLICACTSSAEPLFDGRLIRPGTHINLVGAFTPTTREADTETVRRARVIIDAESAAGREAGDLLIPISEGAIESRHIKGTLAELVTGKVAGRESPEEITLFKSCGLAIEDLVTARLAYERAMTGSIGTRVSL